MTININSMNPVPLWPSKDNWQCKQPTFHDAMAWAVVVKGKLPAMALTAKGDMPSASANSATARVSGFEEGTTEEMFNGNYTGQSGNAAGMNTVTLTGGRPHIGNNVIRFVPYDGVHYKVYLEYTVQNSATVTYMVYDNDDKTTYLFSREFLMSGEGEFCINVGSGLSFDYKTFSLTNVSIDYRSSIQASILVKKFNDNSTAATTTQTLKIDSCVPYYSPDRKGHAWLGGQTIDGTFADGVYYMEVTIDNITYYSEPFMWLSRLTSYTFVTYRRSRPVMTTENYISFVDREGNTRDLSMLLPNIPQKPQFKFEEEVVEIDGRKYAEKQVSYYEDRISFNCYDAYRNAIRLLWHCDIRYVGGNRVDYMEQPEMDWNNDNHLCDISLAFQRDTVVQTNGTASAYIDSSDAEHQSYDSSFDESFD